MKKSRQQTAVSNQPEANPRLLTLSVDCCLLIADCFLMRLDDIKESALMAFDTLRANKLR